MLKSLENMDIIDKKLYILYNNFIEFVIVDKLHVINIL